MRLQSVWNVLLAVGYWCLIHVAKAQIQTEEDVSSTEPRASLGLDMTTKMPDDQYSTQVPCTSRYNGYCLNGGTCFSMLVGHNQRASRCECPLEYIGRRCERSVSLETRSGKPEEKNYVIAGAVCGSLIILALVGIICILVRRRQSQLQEHPSEPLVTREALV
ncbi:pro-neuregulin-4, membrane-bound isoform-like isoform X2 [Branchiostoma lanceolatum]|uniref:pro-neuregulin-4, membrane-bound isoform-like isoform X2 n=1 Tax=Branchiostoma lanceolatum TaxID=7740 RepID=UPI003452AC7F